MDEDRTDMVIRRAIGGDAGAVDLVVAGAGNCQEARAVAVAAILASRSDWIARAQSLALTTRDRQIVAIGAAHLAGERERVQMLARDHLSEHPGSLIVAWIASLAPGSHPSRE